MANRPTARRDPKRNARLVDYLARERWSWLCALARRAGVPPQAVDDVVQSALLDVLRSFPGPDEVGHAAAYAASCVKTEAWKLHRRHARKEGRHALLPKQRRGEDTGEIAPLELPDANAADPLEAVIAAEATADALALLAALPEDERAVLLLRAAGFDATEIAEHLHVSVRGVRKRIERANRALREREEGRATGPRGCAERGT
jgi:RNA polymerase sigma factor (sigma-70 family)